MLWKEIRQRNSELSHVLMELKAFHTQLELKAPQPFKHHWRAKLEKIKQQSDCIVKNNKKKDDFDYLHLIDKILDVVDYDIEQAVVHKRSYLDACELLDSQRNYDALWQSWQQRMELHYQTAKASYRLILALECVEELCQLSHRSPCCDPITMRTLNHLEDAINQLKDLICDDALKPLQYELFEPGHKEALLQSVKEFIKELHVKVYDYIEKTSFFGKKYYEVHENKAKTELRETQIKWLQQISEHVPTNDYRLAAVQYVINQIDEQQSKIHSRFKKLLQSRLDDYLREGMSMASQEELQHYLDANELPHSTAMKVAV